MPSNSSGEQLRKKGGGVKVMPFSCTLGLVFEACDSRETPVGIVISSPALLWNRAASTPANLVLYGRVVGLEMFQTPPRSPSSFVEKRRPPPPPPLDLYSQAPSKGRYLPYIRWWSRVVPPNCGRSRVALLKTCSNIGRNVESSKKRARWKFCFGEEGREHEVQNSRLNTFQAPRRLQDCQATRGQSGAAVDAFLLFML